MGLFADLDSAALGLTLFALLLGAFTQGAAGFGFGLVTTPLLLWAGLPLPVAVTMMLTGTLVQTGAACFRHRRDILWRDAWGMMSMRTLGMPIGLAAMVWVSQQELSLVKQIVGGVLLAAMLLVVLVKPQPRARVAKVWTPTAGLTSGFMSGMIGMSAPALVLWVMAHDWDIRRSRVFMWLMFFQLMPLQLAAMAWQFGWPVGQGIAAGLVTTPLLIGAGMAGAKAGNRWSRQRLRAVTLAMLLVLAVVSILGPWLG